MEMVHAGMKQTIVMIMLLFCDIREFQNVMEEQRGNMNEVNFTAIWPLNWDSSCAQMEI